MVILGHSRASLDLFQEILTSPFVIKNQSITSWVFQGRYKSLLKVFMHDTFLSDGYLIRNGAIFCRDALLAVCQDTHGDSFERFLLRPFLMGLSHIPGMCDLSHIDVALGGMRRALVRFPERVEFFSIWTAVIRKIEISREITGCSVIWSGTNASVWCILLDPDENNGIHEIFFLLTPSSYDCTFLCFAQLSCLWSDPSALQKLSFQSPIPIQIYITLTSCQPWSAKKITDDIGSVKLWKFKREHSRKSFPRFGSSLSSSSSCTLPARFIWLFHFQPTPSKLLSGSHMKHPTSLM